jgi:hypothetical protein
MVTVVWGDDRIIARVLKAEKDGAEVFHERLAVNVAAVMVARSVPTSASVYHPASTLAPS